MQSYTLAERIEGTPRTRIIREFATNAGLFPLFDAIRVITSTGIVAYVTDVPKYLLIGTAIGQAWFLGFPSSRRWWERVAGNLVGPALYTVLDMILEGPSTFFTEPYHLILWVFALGMALISLIEHFTSPEYPPLIIIHNLWRVMLFPSIYFIGEMTAAAPNTALTWDAFVTYIQTGKADFFVLLAATLFGIMLGFSEIEVSRHTGFLRRASHQLKEYAEWLLDPEQVEKSLEDASVLSQRRVERTVMFMDVRGFTSWSETQEPERVVAMLDDFYEVAEEQILKGNGQKPHFIGDEVMTWFDDPQKAFETTKHLRDLVRERLSPYGLSCGAGLHTGEVIEGIMGSSRTRTYDILGDTVNTAARLCSSAAPNEILISDSAVARLGLTGNPGPEKQLEVKGKQEPLTCYAV